MQPGWAPSGRGIPGGRNSTRARAGVLGVAASLLISGLPICIHANPIPMPETEPGPPSLELIPGARGAGMGGAYSAAADDATCFWWNPAALGYLTGYRGLLLRPASQLAPEVALDMCLYHQAFAGPVPGPGGLGVSRTYVDYGTWLATDPTGQEIGEIHSWETVHAIAYGIELARGLAMGAGLKRVKVALIPQPVGDIARAVDSQWALDFGLQWRKGAPLRDPAALQAGPPVELVASASALNLGHHLEFSEAKIPLRGLLRLGLGFVVRVDPVFRMASTVEMAHPLTGRFRDHRGVFRGYGYEGTLLEMVSGRTGYWHDRDARIAGSTYGFGLQVPLASRLDLRFDWGRHPFSPPSGYYDPNLQRYSGELSYHPARNHTRPERWARPYAGILLPRRGHYENEFGASPAIGLAGEAPFSRGLALETNLAFVPMHRDGADPSGLDLDTDITEFSAGIRASLHEGESFLGPYLLAGGGGFRDATTWTEDELGHRVDHLEADLMAGYYFGTGLRWRAAPASRWALDVRLRFLSLQIPYDPYSRDEFLAFSVGVPYRAR